MGEPLSQPDPEDRHGSVRPPAVHWRSPAFWAWWAALSVLFLFGIATVISVEAPDDVSVPRAIVLNASNLLTSLSAAYAVTRSTYRNGVVHRPPPGGSPEAV